MNSRKNTPQPVGATRPRVRVRRLEIRWTAAEYEQLQALARSAERTVSDYVRDTVLHKKIVPKVDQMWLGELRRIGALLRHSYPSVKSWSAQEKKNTGKSAISFWN